MAYQVTERLYVDNNDKVYTEDQLDERSEVRLLMSAGGELTDEEAKRYGLTGKAAKAAAAETKAVEAAPANKAASARADK